MVLSSPRKGKFSGKVLIVNERNDWPIRYAKIVATFHADNELLPLYVEHGECVFPEVGPYRFAVYQNGDAVSANAGITPQTPGVFVIRSTVVAIVKLREHLP